jgi:hypothetical protein
MREMQIYPKNRRDSESGLPWEVAIKKKVGGGKG